MEEEEEAEEAVAPTPEKKNKKRKADKVLQLASFDLACSLSSS